MVEELISTELPPLLASLQRSLEPLAALAASDVGGRSGYAILTTRKRLLNFTDGTPDIRVQHRLCWLTLGAGSLTYVDASGQVHRVRLRSLEKPTTRAAAPAPSCSPHVRSISTLG